MLMNIGDKAPEILGKDEQGRDIRLRKERRDRYLFQIEYEQLYNKEVKECLGKLENHQELVYIT